MTVSTVVASLLPIMWSTRVGAEVMKPLATPVLGGMVSSLLHVLVVTPVIFFWIHERRLGLQREVLPGAPTPTRLRPAWIAAAALVIVVVSAVATWRVFAPDRTGMAADAEHVVQTVRAGDVEIVLRSSTGALHQGRNQFTIEFRESGGDALIDVGTVRASANMPMPGMVMSSGLRVDSSGTPGRYVATAEFGMAGAWQMTVEWDGPDGRGTVNFEGSVQ
jgi:Cu(I)/Ag(I) efflux system membrane protein CusA/SilA